MFAATVTARTIQLQSSNVQRSHIFAYPVDSSPNLSVAIIPYGSPHVISRITTRVLLLRQTPQFVFAHPPQYLIVDGPLRAVIEHAFGPVTSASVRPNVQPIIIHSLHFVFLEYYFVLKKIVNVPP